MYGQAFFESFPKGFADSACTGADSSISFNTWAYFQHHGRESYLKFAEEHGEALQGKLDALGVEQGLTRIAKFYENVQHDDALLFMDLRALLQGSNGAYPPANFPAVHCYGCGRHSAENSALWCVEFDSPWCLRDDCHHSWCEHGGAHVLDLLFSSSLQFEYARSFRQFELGLSQLHWMIKRLRALRSRAHKGDVNGQTKDLFESLPGWTWHPHSRTPLTIKIRGETCDVLGHSRSTWPASSPSSSSSQHGDIAWPADSHCRIRDGCRMSPVCKYLIEDFFE